MKKWIAVFLLAVLLLAMSGCDPYIPRGEIGEELASFPTDGDYPVKLVKTARYWVSLVGWYGGSDYGISVSDTAQELHTVYSAENVSIWFLDADDEYVVWCERSDEYYTYKAYSIQNKTTETVFQTIHEEVMQLQNIAVYNGAVYYAYMDYDLMDAHIFRYDLQKKTAEPIFSAAWEADRSIMSFAAQDGLMSIAVPAGITVLDLTSGEVVFHNPLPADTYYVFAVAYDAVNQTCAMYYRDGDSEDIGILRQGDTTALSVYTFGSNQYAYQDQIRCINGHIYWISQYNVSGNVTEHYSLVEYDYLNHVPNETSRTLNFYVDGDGTYLLRFDRNGHFENIELSQR